MKFSLFVLSTVAVLSAALVSFTPSGPALACPASNDLVATNNGDAFTQGSGVFDYTFNVESWALTFSPTGLVLDFYPITTTNVVEIQEPPYPTFTPSSIYVQGRGCEWDGGDDPDVIAVQGTLVDPDMPGNVTNKITLGAVGNAYSEPLDTSIPPR